MNDQNSAVTGVNLTLAENGGPTKTRALMSTSDSIDKGDPALCPGNDQRLFGRSGACDVGAFEYNGTALAPAAGERD
jgi:hypothetical protein